MINIKYLLTKQTDGLLTGVNLKLTTHWSEDDTARLWTHPDRKEIFYWMTTQILREVIHLKHFMSYSIWLAARDLSYAPSHRQDSTYHGLCYTSCEAPECPNNYDWCSSEMNAGCCIFLFIYHTFNITSVILSWHYYYYLFFKTLHRYDYSWSKFAVTNSTIFLTSSKCCSLY